jgi:hypothetical protein
LTFVHGLRFGFDILWAWRKMTILRPSKFDHVRPQTWAWEFENRMQAINVVIGRIMWPVHFLGILGGWGWSLCYSNVIQ